MKITIAAALPIYDRAIAKYPHLSSILYAKAFCKALCKMAAVPTITATEYWRVAHFAEFGECAEWNMESVR